MKKSKLFIKKLKNINSLINSLLEKNLNKLKLKNLIKLTKNNKIVLTFVALLILFLTYLLLPTLYKQSEISKELQKELRNKFNLSLNFSKKINYNFFPRPHFTSNDSSIYFEQKKISQNKKIKMYVSIDNLFSYKNIEVKDLVIQDANFSLDIENYNFFYNLLENNFFNKTLNIKNSNVFFMSKEKEILFINKISKMKYYYDSNELKNIISSKNEIFNLPYSIKIYDDKKKKILYSKLISNPLRLQIESNVNYRSNIKKGTANLNLNNLKSIINFEKNNNLVKFSLFDFISNPSFLYEGKFNLKPFYSNLNGKTHKFNVENLLGTNAFISELLKTEQLNNKNIDFELSIDAKQIYKYSNFTDLKFNTKIRDGLIDFDQTELKWNNSAKLKLFDSLIFVKNGELILDGRLNIEIVDYKNLYKFLLTPKKYRNKLKKINLNIIYNFDQKTLDLKDIRVDGKLNQNLNKILNNLTLKNSYFQNKIYLKNLFNEALKIYAG